MRSGTETLTKLMTMLGLLAGAVNAIAHEPQLQCSQSPPVDLATHIFDEHYHFFIDEQPEEFLGLATKEFSLLIDEHAACADTHGICVIDYDPWLNAQDGYIDGDINYAELTDNSTRTKVELTFLIRTHPDHKAIPRTTVLTFVRDNADDCWRMDDLLAGRDSSLKEQLKQDLPRYKAAREASTRGLKWTLLEFDTYSSRIEVLRDDRSLGTYNLNCDASPEANELEYDLSIHEINRADIVSLNNDGSNLLVVVCNHGAHSREISIFDTSRRSDEPVWSKVGSYFADWQLVHGDLSISYDLPCTDDVCDQPFATTEVSWNALTDQGLAGCGEK